MEVQFGFDPASEDDMDDNGMTRYMEANFKKPNWHLEQTTSHRLYSAKRRRGRKEINKVVYDAMTLFLLVMKVRFLGFMEEIGKKFRTFASQIVKRR